MPTPACGPFLLALLLCACGEQTRPSKSQDAELNEAADLLDSAPERLSAVDEELPEPPEPRNGD